MAVHRHRRLLNLMQRKETILCRSKTGCCIATKPPATPEVSSVEIEPNSTSSCRDSLQALQPLCMCKLVLLASTQGGSTGWLAAVPFLVLRLH
jgi:hypothetical protein